MPGRRNMPALFWIWIISGSWKRRPRVASPGEQPGILEGHDLLLPKRASSQRIGREKATLRLFQRMDLSKRSPAISPGSASASTSTAGRPAWRTTATT